MTDAANLHHGLQYWNDQDVLCPECYGETAVQTWKAGECAAGCDTSVRYCLECDWTGEPE